MRSLTVKLLLSFLVVNVVGIGLAAVLISQFVARQFDEFLLNRQRLAFVGLVTAYYQTHDTWAGFAEMTMLQGQFISGGDPPPVLPPTAHSPLTGGDGPPLIPPPPSAFLPPFVLLDSEGRAIVAGAKYARNALVPPAERVGGLPILVNGRVVGTVLTADLLTLRDRASEEYLARTNGVLALAALGAGGVALVLGGLLAYWITRPLRELTAATAAVAGGELGRQVPVRSRDELGHLAARFNQMSTDLARAIQARRQLTADIAHDLRSPLTVLAGYLEALRDNMLQPTPARFATLYEETELLLRLTEDLHLLALADAGELRLTRERVAPGALLAHIAAVHQQQAVARQGVALQVVVEEPVPAVWGDPQWLTRALTNLVGNALRYTPTGGQITLTARPARAGRVVELLVTDTGAGIAPEHLPSLFERTYRADPVHPEAGSGSGLGLAIVKSLVTTHGGQVGVSSTVGQGTTFTITLPAANAN
jgi:signal transduction histidine kinase